MFELVQVGQNTYYVEGPAKIGIYVLDGDEIYIIDSGNDKDAGRKLRQLIEKQQWRIRAIINTHANADHIGGNKYLQGQFNCPIYANGIEQTFTRYPVLEPSFLYGGYPCRELRHKFLEAQPSNARSFDAPGFPTELDVIVLPGHFFDMVGLRTPDDVVFLADCISSRDILEKYAIPFIYDVTAYLKTLDKVEGMQAAIFVPSHAPAATDIRELVQYNRNNVYAVANRIEEICAVPLPFERILQQIFSTYGLTIGYEQYVLIGSTIRSYLSWLKDNDRLNVEFTDNMMLWKSK